MLADIAPEVIFLTDCSGLVLQQLLAAVGGGRCDKQP